MIVCDTDYHCLAMLRPWAVGWIQDGTLKAFSIIEVLEASTTNNIITLVGVPPAPHYSSFLSFFLLTPTFNYCIPLYSPLPPPPPPPSLHPFSKVMESVKFFQKYLMDSMTFGFSQNTQIIWQRGTQVSPLNE